MRTKKSSSIPNYTLPYFHLLLFKNFNIIRTTIEKRLSSVFSILRQNIIIIKLDLKTKIFIFVVIAFKKRF